MVLFARYSDARQCFEQETRDYTSFHIYRIAPASLLWNKLIHPASRCFQRLLLIVLLNWNERVNGKFSGGMRGGVDRVGCGINERTGRRGREKWRKRATVYTKCLQVVELIRGDINWRKVIISAGSSCSVV